MKTKSIYYFSLLLVTIISLAGCKVDEPMLADYGARDKELLYMPQAAKNPFVNEIFMSNDDQEIVFGAAYGGLGYPDADIPVSFKVTTENAAIFNDQYNTNYPLLPAESYQLTGTTALIAKGQSTSNPLKVKIKTLGGIDPFKHYILPLTMESNHPSIKVNDKLKTTYLIIRATPNLADYPIFDKTGWSVHDFSTEEANGEGPNNGRAIFAIDNDPSTYWHSIWSTGELPPPHHISFDMAKIVVLHGIYIVHRSGNPQARSITVEGSMDGTNWDVRGKISNIPTSSNGEVHKFFVTSFKEARYFKVIVTEGARTSTNIAEIGAF